MLSPQGLEGNTQPGSKQPNKGFFSKLFFPQVSKVLDDESEDLPKNIPNFDNESTISFETIDRLNQTKKREVANFFIQKKYLDNPDIIRIFGGAEALVSFVGLWMDRTTLDEEDMSYFESADLPFKTI